MDGQAQAEEEGGKEDGREDIDATKGKTTRHKLDGESYETKDGN